MLSYLFESRSKPYEDEAGSVGASGDTMAQWLGDATKYVVSLFAVTATMLAALVSGGCAAPPSPILPPTTPSNLSSWSVQQRGSVVEIGYGRDAHYAQYAALHTESGYFRLVFGPDSGWGTSVVLLPSFWSGGQYFQGAPINADWRIEGDDLVVSFDGDLSALHVAGEVRLEPPGQDTMVARVALTTTGTVPLDRRADEAFKPVMLSSMHVSPMLWDTDRAFVDRQLVPIPDRGWVIQPAQSGRTFGLRGGTSSWKRSAPTMTIHMDAARPVTGWVTESQDPNDDNVAWWQSSNQILSSWRYTITATKS